MIKIKICGIKRDDEVAIINQFPVSYAGFIFAKSKRQVDANRCIELAKDLRKDIKKVGVFVNEPIDHLLEIITTCQLDIVQLHGDETVEYIRQIHIPVWKTIPVKNEESLQLATVYKDAVAGILFETYHEKLRGGTGTTFDWNILKKIEEQQEYAMILAGGINPENIGQAILHVTPDILDVNSGVEEEGFKTYNRIKKLFEEIEHVIEL